jgi:hypothetical protein
MRLFKMDSPEMADEAAGFCRVDRPNEAVPRSWSQASSFGRGGPAARRSVFELGVR